MRKKIIIIVIIAAVIFSLGIFKDQVLKALITAGASTTLGAPVHIDGFSLSLLNQSVKIKGFKIYQPKGYPKGLLLDMPVIAADYDLSALLKGKARFPSVELNLREVVIVKNEAGEFNVDSLAVSDKPAAAPKKGQAKNMPFRIDTLKLNLGRVVSKDYSGGGAPSIKVMELNIDRAYKNITSAQQLIGLIIVESMKSAAIRGAKIYGAAGLAGVAFLPAGLAAALTSGDSASDTFSVGPEAAYRAGLKLLAAQGTIKKENPQKRTINAKVEGVNVAMKVIESKDGRAKVTISARKFFIPKKHVADTLLYELADKLR